MLGHIFTFPKNLSNCLITWWGIIAKRHIVSDLLTYFPIQCCNWFRILQNFYDKNTLSNSLGLVAKTCQFCIYSLSLLVTCIKISPIIPISVGYSVFRFDRRTTKLLIPFHPLFSPVSSLMRNLIDEYHSSFYYITENIFQVPDWSSKFIIKYRTTHYI